MSKPSFSNIDLWLFEYAEGNLSDSQVAQLELFVIQHPELDVDRDMWEMAQVQKQPVDYNEQSSLYRRKPVAAYWAVGTGVTVMLALMFVGYAFFNGDDEVATNLNRLTFTEAATEQYAMDLVNSTSIERELKGEVADLKALVASLENELHHSRRGVLTNNQLASNTGIGNNAEQTGVDNGNFRELRAFGNSNGSIASNSANQFQHAGNNHPVGGNQNTVNVGGAMSSVIAANSRHQMNTSNPSNAIVGGTDVSSAKQELLARIAPKETTLSLKPNVLQVVSNTIQPISRNVFVNNESSVADGSEDNKEINRSRISVDYEESYKYKMSRFVRNIRRMANNPIALKNYRDASHLVPGTSQIDLNFGATGTMIAPRLQAVSRLQNYGGPNELFSNQIGFDGYIYDMRGGIGVQMTHNYYNNGGIQSGEVAITYSPKFSVNQKISLEPAFRFKMGNKMLDANRMEGASQVEFIPGNAINYYVDGTTPVGRMLWYRDLGVGLNVNTEWFYASAQVDNIFRHRDNIYSNDLSQARRAGTYFVATVGTDWESSDSQWETARAKFSISPYLVYRNYENINELWAGANFRAYWLTIGAAISTNMDPSASLGIVSSNKRFSFTYNADYSRSIVTNERSLSHQLTLRLVGKQSRVGRRH